MPQGEDVLQPVVSKRVEACRELLNTRSIQEPLTEDVVKLITLILTKNNSFNNKHNLKLKGTAMGTCMASSHANIFMDNFER